MRARHTMLAIWVGLCLLGSGCNTIKGIGKDIHDSAQTVQVWLEGTSANADFIPPG